MFEVVHINNCLRNLNVQLIDSEFCKKIVLTGDINLRKSIISRFHQSLGRDLVYTMKAIWKSSPPTAKQNGTYNPEHQS